MKNNVAVLAVKLLLSIHHLDLEDLFGVFPLTCYSVITNSDSEGLPCERDISMGPPAHIKVE